MSDQVLFEEFHLSVFVSKDLTEQQSKAMRRALDSRKFRRRLRRVIRRLFAIRPALRPAVIKVSW
jgi:hypothetical protein